MLDWRQMSHCFLLGPMASQVDQEHIYLIDQVLDKDGQAHVGSIEHLMVASPDGRATI